MEINGINPGKQMVSQVAGDERNAKPANFSAMLKHYVEQTNMQEHQADQAASALAEGKTGNLSETLLAVEKADLSSQLLFAVRNKLVSAYHEVMRMQV
ncbi:MAG TPA: flagellar hook-basal body complex protein FliE [Mariprofundaceae bacterium]|nr:flagellar hook-basal body complex protein FliE [Mariprofundaceae bacterium]